MIPIRKQYTGNYSSTTISSQDTYDEIKRNLERMIKSYSRDLSVTSSATYTTPDILLDMDWEQWLMDLRQRIWLEQPKRIVVAPATARGMAEFYHSEGWGLPVSLDEALGVKFMNTPITELEGLPELVAIFEE